MRLGRPRLDLAAMTASRLRVQQQIHESRFYLCTLSRLSAGIDIAMLCSCPNVSLRLGERGQRAGKCECHWRRISPYLAPGQGRTLKAYLRPAVGVFFDVGMSRLCGRGFGARFHCMPVVVAPPARLLPCMASGRLHRFFATVAWSRAPCHILGQDANVSGRGGWFVHVGNADGTLASASHWCQPAQRSGQGVWATVGPLSSRSPQLHSLKKSSLQDNQHYERPRH